jgi:hypothetical protein
MNRPQSTGCSEGRSGMMCRCILMSLRATLRRRQRRPSRWPTRALPL